MGNNIWIRDTEFFIMILPKPGDNYLKCILLCFHAEHWVWLCNMFAQNTCPMLFTKFYGNSTFISKIMEFILIVYSKNMNNKDGAKKLAMSTKQMQDIFSPMFSCVLRENIFSVLSIQFCAQTFMRTYFLFLGCFHQWWWWYAIWQLVRRSDVCCKNRKYVLVNVCTQNWTLKNTEGVLPEDAGH